MGELFKNKLEFLEWYIGFELIDLLHNSGFVKIKSIDISLVMTPRLPNIRSTSYFDLSCFMYHVMGLVLDFIINFNRRKRIPNWVLEYLTKESMNNLTAGRHGVWSPDPDFSEIFQPKYADYECHPNSIHNHGHLATGNLHPHEQGFYLTNSVPQYNLVNSGHWRVIEEYIR
uniref:DNA/RNA non-specific endonuclease domain-containing protein n=1 Tax=Meloidogyne javanica TaxID=6303 RepID=A0A915LEQ8_MELJA